jgi:predicted membrane protein
MDLVLPEDTANLSVTAKSGAGNVVVLVPSGIATRIHASTGLGKVIVDSRFGKIDGNTYQSSDFDSAANKVEITVHSGAGNVSVNTK